MNRRLLLSLTLGLATPALLVSAPAAAQLPEGDGTDNEDELSDEEKRRIKEKIEAEEKARIEAEVREKLKKEAEARARESQQSDAERRAADEARRIEAEQKAREERLRLEALEKINARKRAEEEERMRIRAEMEAQIRAEQEAKIRAEEEARARATAASAPPPPPGPTTPGLTAAERAEAERRARERADFERETEEEDRKLREKLEKGRSVVAGVSANHSWTVTFSQVDDPDIPGQKRDVSSSTLFLNAGPKLGFFVGPEGLEVNISGGLLWRQIPVGANGETAVEFDGYVGPGVNFHMPLSPRLFWLFGADGAFFWGGGSRPQNFVDQNDIAIVIDRETDSFGFLGNLHTGPGYFINPVFQVRATLVGSTILGFESLKENLLLNLPGETIFTPTFNTGINIGIFAYF